ncbi:MAG: endonuclease/exonuclease/phosphatase family protein [Rubrobacteraceae bacterium]
MSGSRGGLSGEPRRDEVPERSSEELRVMSFNVRGSRRPDGKNAWKKRAALNVDVIKRWSPDLIGFQEFQRGNHETYEKELPGYESALGPKYENKKPHAFNAIFWDTGRMERLDSGGFWLSQTPDEFSGSWNTAQRRSANWMKFRLVPEEREFVHLNTHLDHKSIPARQKGTRLIVEKLDAMGNLPQIVTGDFNAEPGKLVYETFSEAGFEDAHVRAGNPRTKTFHRFRGEDFAPKKSDREWRMDWVLIRDGDSGKWDVNACLIVRDCDPPVFPSDHYPVTARLFLR